MRRRNAALETVPCSATVTNVRRCLRSMGFAYINSALKTIKLMYWTATILMRIVCLKRAFNAQRGGDDYGTSPQTVSPSDRGRCCASDGVASCLGASLSDTAGTLDRGLSRWWHGRHRRAPDRTMAIGTLETAIQRREPGGCQQEPGR